MKARLVGAYIANFKRWMFRLDRDLAALIERGIADLEDTSPEHRNLLLAKLVVLNGQRAALEPHIEAWPASVRVERAELAALEDHLLDVEEVA